MIEYKVVQKELVMANIADIAEALASEARLAQKYENLQQKAINEKFKKDLDNLLKLSVQKMKILRNIIKEGPWLENNQSN